MVYIEDGWAGGRRAMEIDGLVDGCTMQTDGPVNGEQRRRVGRCMVVQWWAEARCAMETSAAEIRFSPVFHDISSNAEPNLGQVQARRVNPGPDC